MFYLTSGEIQSIISHLKNGKKIAFNVGSLQPTEHRFSFEAPSFIYQCNDQRRDGYWERSWESEAEFADYLLREATEQAEEGLRRAIRAVPISAPGNLTPDEIARLIHHLKNKGDLSVQAATPGETGGWQPLLLYFSYVAPGRIHGYQGTPKFSYQFSDLQGAGYWIIQDYESETAFAQFLAQEVDSQVAMGFRVILGS
jgi:hypothetical protein